MAKDGLFTWLDACWNKKHPDGTPPIFMMHRFLSSDPDMAQAARVFQLEIREPELVFRTWQGLLPKGAGAPTRPRLTYIAAKKRPAAEELVTRMQQVLGERREVLETMVEITRLEKRLGDLYRHFGLEPEDNDDNIPF